MKDAERRNFKMAPKLLYDVITRQAGTIEKSWLEAIMNSVDAGATEIRLLLTKSTSEITDNGKGMSREEIVTKFEIFGEEYSKEEKEAKTYGEFRMGRGQLFAHGMNIWRTGKHKMTVDIKEHGLNYDLQNNLRQFNGCQIHVAHYTKLDGHKLRWAVNRLKEWIRFVQVDIYINDELIAPETASWDYEKETANARYFIKTSGNVVKLYNLGVLVKELHGLGLSGHVISKQRLMVNFARNDVLDECKVWQKIQGELPTIRARALSNAKYLNEGNKEGIMDLLGEKPKFLDRFKGKRIIRTVDDKWVSINQIQGMKIAYAPIGDQVAVATQQDNPDVVIIDDKWKDEVSYMTQELGIAGKLDFSEVDYKELSRDVESGREEIPEGELTKRGEKALKFLRELFKDCGRQILTGRSASFSAWTNGETRVWIDVDYLDVSLKDIGQVVNTMIHELAHDDDDGISHVHGDTFRENFYNLWNQYARRVGLYMRKWSTSGIGKR